ncbi:hypothetical protein V8E36_006868 [Tilletia maclaganii]
MTYQVRHILLDLVNSGCPSSSTTSASSVQFSRACEMHAGIASLRSTDWPGSWESWPAVYGRRDLEGQGSRAGLLNHHVLSARNHQPPRQRRLHPSTLATILLLLERFSSVSPSPPQARRVRAMRGLASFLPPGAVLLSGTTENSSIARAARVEGNGQSASSATTAAIGGGGESSSDPLLVGLGASMSGPASDPHSQLNASIHPRVSLPLHAGDL